MDADPFADARAPVCVESASDFPSVRPDLLCERATQTEDADATQGKDAYV